MSLLGLLVFRHHSSLLRELQACACDWRVRARLVIDSHISHPPALIGHNEPDFCKTNNTLQVELEARFFSKTTLFMFFCRNIVLNSLNMILKKLPTAALIDNMPL